MNFAKHIDIKESEIHEEYLKTGKEKERFQVEFGAAGEDITYETKEKIEEAKASRNYLYKGV